MAFWRKTLEAIGLFEERFFMYCEDVDLNWRAQLAGYRCIYAPRAVVYHHLSATGGGELASYYVGRNTLWVIARNYPTLAVAPLLAPDPGGAVGHRPRRPRGLARRGGPRSPARPTGRPRDLAALDRGAAGYPGAPRSDE